MKSNLKSWLLLALLACIWGSSFILMKKGMYNEQHHEIFSSMQVGAMRMLLAGLVLLPFTIQVMGQLNKRKDLYYFAIVGVCGNFIPAFLFTYAETHISSGLAGIMNSFTPIFTLLLGYLFFDNKITRYQLIGTIIGFCGITILVFNGGSVQSNGQEIIPSLAIVLATFLYGISLNTIKFKLSAYKPIHVAAGGFGIVFIPSIIGFFAFDTIHVFRHNPDAISGFVAITVLAVVGTAFAVFLFNGIIQSSSALFASSVTYLIPIVAVIIGSYFKESITSTQLISMFIVISGVILANYGQQLFKKGRENP
jgi:drug/metabolite transporter (DMT)-like permease